MSSPDLLRRSHLFVPGTQERMLPKALVSDADAVVIDLEDGIDQDRRQEAYSLIESCTEEIRSRPTHIRIGVQEHGYRTDDVELAARLHLEAIRLPKADQPEAVAEVAALLDSAGCTTAIHPTVESARGLTQLPLVIEVSERVSRVVFGERDFLADMGVDEPGAITDHVRASIALTSRAAGIGKPIDGAFVDLGDHEGLVRSCRHAKSLGFGGKSAIHPRQVAPINDVFSPSAEELNHARRILDAFEQARRRGEAVATVDGRFVDEAIARQARSVVALTEGAM